MLRMVSHPHRPQSGHIMCYLNRTYHVLPTNSVLRVGAARFLGNPGTHFPRSILPYTLSVLSWLKIIPFLILAPVCAICQVQVTVPAQSFKASERIACKGRQRRGSRDSLLS